MSNAGQGVLSVVGAVVGFFVGGPTGAIYGFQLGYLAGSALFPTQLPHLQGPRIGDGQRTVSQVGASIPWVHGTQPVGGIIIWASPIREVANTSTAGGKGGPEQSQTTYTYFRSFAILLCEGPIAGVRRIWANGKSIYDRSPIQGVDYDTLLHDVTSAISQQLIGREVINSDWADKMTIYLGDESQLPDPVIESFEGVGNVPAYRGYAYVVFDDVELKAEDGNRMPGSWKFEVYEDADETFTNATYYSQEILYPWLEVADPTNPLNVNAFAGGSFIGDSVQEVVDAAAESCDPGGTCGFTYSYVADHQVAQNHGGGRAVGYGTQAGPAAWSTQGQTSDRIYLNMGPFPVDNVNEHIDTNPITCGNLPLPGQVTYGVDSVASNFFVYNTGLIDATPPTPPDPWDPGFNCWPTGPYTWGMLSFDVSVTRTPGAPQDPADVGVPIEGVSDAYVVDGVVMPAQSWVRDVGSYHVMRLFDGGAGLSVPVVEPLGPALPVGHFQDTEAFWTGQYEAAVARGDIEAGLVYGVDYPQPQGYAYVMATELSIINTNPISIATIITRICNRCAERLGTSFSFDVTDLEDRYVVGYQLSRPMAGRAGIETLRPVGFFDVIESSVQLKFPTRGKAAVLTLTDDDLGAFFEGEQRPSKVTTSKALELELPRQIRVHYQDPARDYDPGEQLSPARFDTKAETVTDIDLGVAIHADDAAKSAEVAYRDAWASRWLHGTSLDISKSAIEPADCIIVPVDGSNERLRILKRTDKLPNLLALEMVRDDDGTYVSTAVGSTPLNPPTGIVMYGPVAMDLLDLPALSPTQETPAIYVALRPEITTGAFRGGVVQRSSDGGGTYQIVGSGTTASSVGEVLTPAGVGPSEIFDLGGELVVELEYGTLTSATEEQVLSGDNAAAVGIHGRWEILQFMDAELISGKVYRLTGLLRGRLGTEYAIGTGEAGDRFVMLENTALLPMAVTEIGAELLYKATPVNTPQAATGQVELIAHNATLKPYAPVHIEGDRDDDGDLAITWVRRDRLADPTGVETTVPMSEAFEDYEVDILDANGETRRTISTSTESAVYTAEMQTDDFGALQASVPVNVYQMSQQVGRGFAGAATL